MRSLNYSPYAPRPRRSAQLVVLWMVVFIGILVATWYISTRHTEAAAEYVDKLLRKKLHD
ncbi:hypothetical protein B0H67DRAFT_593515 [Lasiosphaeris hirsuta]|uniref:Uncharacterized protein n=1 Tax=Lasiosphaeris hirsuta TaxID=260670 RepID=A0AA39ZX17_9PEZI|nr:hypothetical protein B0H67DRAFT_593515 [Lasiosphaeris hirsuta]